MPYTPVSPDSCTCSAAVQLAESGAVVVVEAGTPAITALLHVSSWTPLHKEGEGTCSSRTAVTKVIANILLLLLAPIIQPLGGGGGGRRRKVGGHKFHGTIQNIIVNKSFH